MPFYLILRDVRGVSYRHAGLDDAVDRDEPGAHSLTRVHGGQHRARRAHRHEHCALLTTPALRLPAF